MLKGERTVNEIASEHSIIPKNLKNWKEKFLANAELAMEPSKAVKEYKDENQELKAKIDEYARVVGKITVERDWLQGKLKDLDLSNKQEIVEPKSKVISLSHQCVLLGISRSTFYYEPVVNEKKIAIKKEIEKIYEEIPIYGEKKVYQQLLENGFSVSLNSVSKYRKELGLRAILSWEISSCMDTDLVMGVLNKALKNHGTPEIFNSDQGSQYTSHIHTQTLKDKGIIISMDGKGRATDNICIERFWRSAKVERIYLNEYSASFITPKSS